MNYRNSLFIGLGGSGAKSILHAKAYFKNRGKEIPSNVKFLAIDTDPAVLNEVIETSYGKIKIEQNEFLHLNDSANINLFHNKPELFSYLPKGAEVHLGDGPGAKQIRSIGLSKLQSNYNRAFNDINNRISQIIAFDGPGENGMVNVSFVTSIAGGTGSGTFIAINAMIRKILGEKSEISLYAITPDVFTRFGDTNPAFANIFQNAYAALMELEMLESSKEDVFLPLPDGSKLNLRAKSPEFIYTVTNKIGDFTINDPHKVYELVGKALFTASGSLQSTANSVFNNVLTQRDTPGNEVEGKKSCAMGIGVAEIQFDSNYLANIYLNRYKSGLVNSLLKCQDEIIEPTVEDIVTRYHFKEDNGFDMLIDSLLDPQASIASFSAANNNTINAMVSNFVSSEISNKEKKASDNLTKRKEAIKLEIKKELKDFFKSNGVECTIKVIEGLIHRTSSSFLKEMQEELESLMQDVDSIKLRLDSEIQNYIGISGIFTSRQRNEAVQNIQLYAREYVTNKAEIIRRNGAIEFYNFLVHTILKEEQEIYEKSKRNLVEIANTASSSVKNLINVSNKKISEFTIDLHLDYVNASFVNPSGSEIDEKAFMSNINLDQFLTDSKERISSQIESFVKEKNEFKEVLNKDIKSVLSNLSKNDKEKVNEILKKVVRNSTPSWNTKAIMDYTFPSPLLDLFIIGVGDSDNNIFHQKEFDELFLNEASLNDKDNDRSLVSTGDYSRIIFFRIQSMRPLFVLHGVNNWREKYVLQKAKTSNNYDPTTLPHSTIQSEKYVDENFYDLFPGQGRTEPRKVWVSGIIYELIKRDSEGYKIKSEKKGRAAEEYLFNLGVNRKQAYDVFTNDKFYIELEAEVAEFEKKLTEFEKEQFAERVKTLATYRDLYAQLEYTFDEIKQQKDSDQLMRDIYDMVDEEMELITKELIMN